MRGDVRRLWQHKFPILAAGTFLVSTTLLLSDRLLTKIIAVVPADIRVAGRVVDTSGEVLRQSTFLLIWQDLVSGDAIYDGDRVFSNHDSTAVLALKDVNVRLPELSLLEITLEGELTKIKVEQGKAELTFSRDGQILVEIDGEEKKLQAKANTQVLLQRDELNHPTSLTLIKGSARLNDEVDLKAGDTARFAKGQTQMKDGTEPSIKRLTLRSKRKINTAT